MSETIEPSRGAVSYSYVADTSQYSGSVGSTVQVDVYLQEALTNLSDSFIVDHGGLTAAGAAINVASNTGGYAAQIGMNSFAVSPAFAGLQTVLYNQGGNDLEFTESIARAAPSSEPFNSRILLGVLNVTVGPGTTTYELTSLADDTIPQSDYGLGRTDGNTTTMYTNGGFDLDVTQAGLYTGADDVTIPYTFTVSPVPEPSAVIMPCLLVMLVRAQRHRSTGKCTK